MVGGNIPATVSRVNKELKSLGREERVAQGRGYIYFYGGDTDYWPETSIYVNRIGQLTVQQVIDEFNQKREDYRDRVPRSRDTTTRGKLFQASRRVAASSHAPGSGVPPSKPVSELASRIAKQFHSRTVVAPDGSIHVLFYHLHLPTHQEMRSFLASHGFRSTSLRGKPNEYNGGVVLYAESSGERWLYVAYAPDVMAAIVSDITPPDK